MKIKPILFSTEMVKAILAARKTQTRRTKGLDFINLSPNDYAFNGFGIEGNVYKPTEFKFFISFKNLINKETLNVYYPFIDRDIIWVRESFWNISYVGNSKKSFIYRADLTDAAAELVTWKPSIHMPKEAARIFLKVTNIRVERLNDITEADAIAEGVYKYYEDDGGFMNYLVSGARTCARVSFETLWSKINGHESLKSNPWVWVIDFERVEKPENFNHGKI